MNSSVVYDCDYCYFMFSVFGLDCFVLLVEDIDILFKKLG